VYAVNTANLVESVVMRVYVGLQCRVTTVTSTFTQRNVRCGFWQDTCRHLQTLACTDMTLRPEVDDLLIDSTICKSYL